MKLLLVMLSVFPMLGQKGDIDANFTDDVFPVKLYSDAKLIKGSSQRLGIDPAWGWAQSFAAKTSGYGRGYSTHDDAEKVQQFYKAELGKLGVLAKNSGNRVKKSFRLPYWLKNGGYLVVNGGPSRDGKGTTFEIYYMPKAKRP